MYCRECGEKYLSDEAIICVKCGVGKGKGNKYCPNCGQAISNSNADICLSCGVALKRIYNSSVQSTNPKSKIVAALLAFFLGEFGIHRFYLGHNKIGFIQLGLCLGGIITFGLTTFGVCIWAFIEFILILTGTIKDVNGQPLI